jgi:hypothetical protein
MKVQPISFDIDKRLGAIRAAALSVVLSLSTGFMQQAGAGCLDLPKVKIPVSDLRDSESSFGAARFIKAGFMGTADEEYAPSFFHAPIVGLWAFKYISEGNVSTYKFQNGMTIDAGNTLWFADGNELTYSAIRNPIVGATCLGIWKRTGEFTYVLNHIGLSWDPTAPYSGAAGPMDPGGGPGAPSGPAFIKQYVVLARDGQSYTGTFTINQLMPDGKTPAGPPITGNITATRVTIDTDTQVQTP